MMSQSWLREKDGTEEITKDIRSVVKVPPSVSSVALSDSSTIESSGEL